MHEQRAACTHRIIDSVHVHANEVNKHAFDLYFGLVVAGSGRLVVLRAFLLASVVDMSMSNILGAR